MVRRVTSKNKRRAQVMAENEVVSTDNDPGNDRIITAIVYVLYLIGPANGVTMLIGVIIAFMRKDQAPAWLATHYEFQIRTVIYAIALFVIAVIGFFTVILIPLSLLIWFLPQWQMVRASRKSSAIARSAADPGNSSP